MKVLITGYGRMGRLIEDTLVKAGDEIAGWIDIENVENLNSDKKIADVIMDFSNPSLTDTVVAYAARTETPLLSGTTNMTEEQHQLLAELAKKVPVIWASNYSLGINLFMHILPQVKAALPDWDIEITETHHNKKVDAPSGTAKSLADVIDPEGEYERVYGRSGNCGERTSREIGMHALRGGTVAGTHEVHFFGPDEEVCLTHRASSRQIFVAGAIAAAKKLAGREPGLYTFDELVL